MSLLWELIDERAVSSALDAEIRSLLVAAYPQYADIFTQASYWGSQPEYRLVGRDPRSRHLLAHLECGPRNIWVAGQGVRILGIGAVAVHPSAQRCGYGREMFRQLGHSLSGSVDADFGLLQCRPAVAPFYRRSGFIQVPQPCTSIDPDSGIWETYSGPVMVLPLRKTMACWPVGGDVNLRGQPW